MGAGTEFPSRSDPSRYGGSVLPVLVGGWAVAGVLCCGEAEKDQRFWRCSTGACRRAKRTRRRVELRWRDCFFAIVQCRPFPCSCFRWAADPVEQLQPGTAGQLASVAAVFARWTAVRVL